MATATVAKAWYDSTNAYLCATVNEAGNIGTVEYKVSTPLLDSQGNTKPLVQLQSELTAAIKAARPIAPSTAPLAITGPLTV
jgi:hypothetical protein